MDDVAGQFRTLRQDAVAKYSELKRTSNVAVKCALAAVVTLPQSAMIGVGSFYLNSMLAEQQRNNPTLTPDMRAQMDKMQAMQPKTRLASVRTFAALFGVQAAVKEALLHLRKERDIWTEVIPAFSAGAAYALASGHPDQTIAMAAGFAGITAVITMVTGGTKEDGAYESKVKSKDLYQKSLAMLRTMGLEKFHGNLKKGEMTDDTIMIWTEDALKDCRIPPGPRLLILHHISQVKSAGPKAREKTMSYIAPVEVPNAFRPPTP